MKRVFYFFVFLVFFSPLFGQVPDVDSEAYDLYKRTSIYTPEKAEYPKDVPIQFTRQARNGLLVPLDDTFSLAMSPNDDGSSALINLPFMFNLYGTLQSNFYINNNGNISFGSRYGNYTAYGFPINGYPMLAAFWADVDTRGAGAVYYRITEHQAVVTWDHVGYYGNQVDKLNTFQVIFSDGLDPTIGIGMNVAFSYGDMQWTTGSASGGNGGFGGTPAMVGVNKGNGVDYALIGRFNQPGYLYDGPGGNSDGIDYLDNQLFLFETGSGSNLPPVFDTHPGNLYVNIGSAINRIITAIGPESNQTVTAQVSTNIPSGFSYSSTPGNPCIINLEITGSINNVGSYMIEITALDNGNPAQNTTTHIYVDIINTEPTISSSPITETYEDELYEYQIQVNDPDFAYGDFLDQFIFDSCPTGMYYDPVNQSIKWIPDNSQTGYSNVGFWISDSFGAWSYQSYQVNVINVNDPPEIYLPGQLSFAQGDSYWFYIGDYYHDIDDEELSLTWSGNNNISIQVDGSLVMLSCGLWYGTESITFTVTDDDGLSASDTITITVIPPKTCYEVNYTSDPSGNSSYQGQTVTVSGVVTAIDPPNNNFFISDPSGGPYAGLLVYHSDIPTVGDLILAKGHLNELTGVTNLSSLEVFTVLQSNHPLPMPSVVAPEYVFDEAWESGLIKVENVISRSPTGSADVFNAQRDYATVHVSDWLYPSGHTWYNVAYGQPFESITGIMDHYGQVANLLPRDDADLEFSNYFSCSQIQYPALGSNDSTYLGQIVTVRGIITARPENRGILWIGDPLGGPWSGLMVHTPITTGEIGDLVQITGTVEEYYSQTEIDLVSSTTIIEPNQELPPVWPVSVGDLSSDNAEMWEGVLVGIQKVSVIDAPPLDLIFMVSDTSNSIGISKRLYPIGSEWENMDPGRDFVEIQGILDYFYDAFRISPRSDADIRELEEYIWVNNANDNNLQLVDTRDNQVYGPFLENMIGNSDGTGITVAGDDTFMLITSFHQGLIYHVNIENPFYPQIVSTYNIGWSVEDISLSQDGRYAVISDGGNSTYIGLIDLESRALVQTINISPRFAQSIEIGPDGKILVGDNHQSMVYQYILDFETGVITDSGISIAMPFSPVNIAIQPDGSHAIVALTNDSVVLSLNSDNSLSIVQTLSSIAAQSIAYSANGEKAYLLRIGVSPNSVLAYDVTPSGLLQPANTYPVQYYASGYYYGLDVLTTNTDGSMVYVAHPTTPSDDLMYAINTIDHVIQAVAALSPVSIQMANLPLNAYFSARETIVETGHPVKFTQYSSGGPESFTWDFGDGSTSNERHPNHVYSSPGFYSVSLQVTSGSYSSAIVKEAYIEVFSGINASIRYVEMDEGSYLPGAEINIQQEIDTILSTQNIRIDTMLMNSGNLIVNQRSDTYMISGTADDPINIVLSVPITAEAGDHQLLTVVYDALSLVEQDRLSIQIEVLDPSPILWIEPQAIAMGHCYVTETYTATVTFGNSGFSNLVISDLSVAAAGFSLETDELIILPGESSEFQISFSPLYSGEIDTNLTALTNAPDHLAIEIPITATCLIYHSPVYHSVSPDPSAPQYIGDLGVLVSLCFADSLIIDASSIQYRYDKNGNGTYDALETWMDVEAYLNAPEITVNQLLSFRRDGDHFCYEFRAQNMRHSGWTYTGFQSEEGIEDDFFVMIDATPPLWIDYLAATTAGENSVLLNWTETFDPRFSGYEIYYGTHPYLSDADILWDAQSDPAMAQLATTQTLITGLEAGTVYYFAIRARDLVGNISEFSDEVSATTSGSTMGINLQIIQSGDSARLIWTEYPGCIGYKIYKSSDPQGPWQFAGETVNTEYDILLTDNKAFYIVRAVISPAKVSQGEAK